MVTHNNKKKGKRSGNLVSVKQQDFLEQDTPIRGQQYVCLSFISPEDILQDKESYAFNQFLGNFSKEFEKLFSNLNVLVKDDKNVQEMLQSVKDRYKYIFSPSELQQEFANYKQMNSETIDRTYLENNQFQTSVRGIKVRGSYETLEEAKNRANNIRKFDNKFDVFVGQVGCWCPWSPYPTDIQDQEYSESALNTLMQKYKENKDQVDEYHKERVEFMMNKTQQEEKDKKEQQKLVEKIDENEEFVI